MSNTYNLTHAYLEVLNKLDEGYSFEDLKDTLDSIEEELNIKVDNTIGLKRSVDADVETIDKEIKRLQTIKNKSKLIRPFKRLLTRHVRSTSIG